VPAKVANTGTRTRTNSGESGKDGGLGGVKFGLNAGEHEANARKWGHATPGQWRVGTTNVSYPEGWTNFKDGSAPPELVVAKEPKLSTGLTLDFP
jgi:hypothetical protein